jgi:hypothetical protein
MTGKKNQHLFPDGLAFGRLRCLIFGPKSTPPKNPLMNKQLRNLFLLGLLALAAWSCKDDDEDAVVVASVALHAPARELLPGEEFTLTATITPSNAMNKGIDWSSSDTEVATVDATGRVKAMASGTTTITAKTQDGGKTATCTVTVGISVSSVILNITNETLVLGDYITLTATVMPLDANNHDVAWSSSDLEVATVDHNGLVTTVATGTTTITATTADGAKIATCIVTVVAQYAFNEVYSNIQTAVYGDYPGGYQFWLYPTVEEDGVFEGTNEYIRIDIPREMMDSTFSLTEDNPYDWDWRVAYRNNATRMTYEGRGFPDGMVDVRSGTLYAVMLGDDAFEVRFEVVFTDGKRLTGKYAGAFVKNNDFYGEPVRKPAGGRHGNF